MSNWVTITVDHLKAAGNGLIMDRAASMSIGGIDPVAEAIAGATARVRRAVQTGNALDIDPTKVPDSLKDITKRLALFALMERIQLPLSVDQRDTRNNDISDLKRITDNRQRVEKADNPNAEAEMQPTPSPAIAPRHRRFRYRDESGI